MKWTIKSRNTWKWINTNKWENENEMHDIYLYRLLSKLCIRPTVEYENTSKVEN